MTKLSVNVNKVATLRNARGGNYPNVLHFAQACESLGAHGITVHPRPDERHIRYSDVFDLKNNIKTELNVEGYPNSTFIQLILDVKPGQVTLVPDPPEAITSNAGWDVKANFDFLKETCSLFRSHGIRTSIFMDTDASQIELASKTGADRIELYTEHYAVNCVENANKAVSEYVLCAKLAGELGMEVNAGHDLNSDNLHFFTQSIPELKEVSIGHALIGECLYGGLENTIKKYLKALQ